MTQTTAGAHPPERETNTLSSEWLPRVTPALSPARGEQARSRRPRMEVQ